MSTLYNQVSINNNIIQMLIYMFTQKISHCSKTLNNYLQIRNYVFPV